MIPWVRRAIHRNRGERRSRFALNAQRRNRAKRTNVRGIAPRDRGYVEGSGGLNDVYPQSIKISVVCVVGQVNERFERNVPEICARALHRDVRQLSRQESLFCGIVPFRRVVAREELQHRVQEHRRFVERVDEVFVARASEVLSKRLRLNEQITLEEAIVGLLLQVSSRLYETDSTERTTTETSRFVCRSVSSTSKELGVS